MSLTDRFSACFSFSLWLERILLHPRKVISGISVITLFFAWHLFHLSFATSVYDMVIENIPETVQYNEFKKLFGSDEIIRIVVKGVNVFEAGTFEKVTRISEEVSRIKGIRRIISLPEIKKNIDISGKLSLEEFADRIRPVELFQRNLISDDFKSTSLTLILSDHADHKAIIQQVKCIIETESHGLTTYQIGIPVVSEALSNLTRKDILLLMPISILMFLIILSLLYRNINCVLLPMICVIIALIWTFGLMALYGIPLSMLTVMVPIFLLAIGVTYYLHICSEYLAFSQTCRDPVQVARLTFSSIAFPTFLAALTTIIGFGSLWINQIPAIREFSFFSCFGILSILVVLFTLYPAALVMLPLPLKMAPGFVAHFFDGLVKKIITLNLNWQHITLPLIIGLSVFCLAGVFRIQVETNPMSYLKADMPVSQHFHDIYKDLSGSFPLNVIMEGNGADYFETPAHVNQILQAQRILEKLPGVDKAMSYADYLMLVNYAMNQFDPKFYAIPEEAFEIRMLINNYKMLLGQDMLTSFMNPEFSKANILLLTHIASSNEFLDARKNILSIMREQFPSSIWQVTGLGMSIASSSQLLTRGQIQSLMLTLAIIFCIMLIFFMSFKVGGISILPNMFPIVINFGAMGWIGIELSMVTSLIAGIAIGMAVDDIIHYLVRYNQKFKAHMDKKLALENTLQHIGNQMIFSSVAVCAGFFILVFSSFKATAIFGIMMVIIMFSGLFADIVILPSLMLHVELVTIWDMLCLMPSQIGMSAEIAHELNQPLNAIKMGSEYLKIMLQQGGRLEAQQIFEVAHEIDTQADRASEIINRLRVFGEKPAFTRESVDINRPIQDTVAILKHQLFLDNINILLDLSPGLPPISAHYHRLSQVFYNLIVNAKEAIEKRQEIDNSKDHTIRIKNYEDAGHVVVTVSDTGIGISDCFRDRVFEPFFTTKETGKGLGMSIVKEIIRDYGGRIVIDCNSAVETTFVLSFPIP